MTLEELDKKLTASEAHATRMRVRYWKHRNDAIAYLGYFCCHCGESDTKKLVIHHIIPVLSSPKSNGSSREVRCGASRIREWKDIVSGKLDAKLVCADCHLKIEHAGDASPTSLRYKK